MSVAKVIEVSAGSGKSFEDASPRIVIPCPLRGLAVSFPRACCPETMYGIR